MLQLLAAVIAAANGEVFSSASDLREVFLLERELVGILQDYAKKLESRLGLINNYLEASQNVRPSNKAVSRTHA